MLDLTPRRRGDPANVDLAALLAELNATKGEIVGSAAIFGHGQDIDVIVEGKNRLFDAVRCGFVYDGKLYDEAEFFSLRRGEINLLLCTPERYATFAAGCAACRVLVAAGLLTYDMKQTRVDIHQYIHEQF